MRTAVLASLIALCVAACSKSDPVADETNNSAAPDIDVLPPDESVATPTNELESGDDEPGNSADPGSGKIPAAFHGRWGLTPPDCTSTRGDNKGLLVVSADELKFYESIGKPAGDLKISDTSISGDFAFTGEGMNWKKYQVLELHGKKLVRTESTPMTSFTYARCDG